MTSEVDKYRTDGGRFSLPPLSLRFALSFSFLPSTVGRTDGRTHGPRPTTSVLTSYFLVGCGGSGGRRAASATHQTSGELMLPLKDIKDFSEILQMLGPKAFS